MAVEKEIIIKVSADANGAVKTVDNLSKSTDKLNTATDKTTDKINVFADVIKYADNGMVEVSASISAMEDKMYHLALQGQQNTEEFKQLQEETARYRQVIISTDKAVDQLAEQGKGLGTALQLGSTIVAGYGAVQGAMALVGSENEQLQKTMVKLQAVQATLASIEQLRLLLDKQSLVVIKAKTIATTVMTTAQKAWTFATSATTVATQALRVAMLALPIVAIIAGLAALVGGIASLFKANETAQESYDELTKSIDQNNEALDRSYAKSKRNAENTIALAKAQGASAQEIHDLELKLMADEEAHRRLQIKNLATQIKERREIYKTALDEGNEELALQIKDEIAQERKKYKDLLDLEGNYQQQVKIKQTQFDNDRAKEQEAKDKEELEKRKKNWENVQKKREEAEKLRLERQQMYEDLMVKNIEDANVRRLAELNLQQERERTQLIEKFGKDTELLRQLTIQQENARNEVLAEISAQTATQRLEAELSNTRLSFEERNKLLIEQAEYERNQALENQKLTADEKLIAENEYIAKLDAIREEERNREFADEKAGIEAKLITMREDFEAQQELKYELFALELEQALANEALTLGEKEKLHAEYNQKLDSLATERAEREKQLNAEVQQAFMNVSEQGINAVSSLSDAYFSNKLAKAKGDERATLALEKKKFETNKKLQIAQATIQGVQAVLSAYSSGSAIPVIGAVMGPIYAALAGVATIANISKIKSQTFDGGGGGMPSISAPSIPEISNTGTSTTGVGSAGNLPNNQPAQPTIKIVDSEIKASQDNLAKVETISSLGG